MLTRTLLLILASLGAAFGQAISNGEQVLPYSSTLTLNAAYTSAYVTLTGNLSSISVPAGRFGGQSFHLTICQGSGGPYTAPAAWTNTTGVTTLATTGCTRFRMVWDDPAGVWVSTAEGQAATGPAGATGAQGPAGTAATPNTASIPLVISGNNIAIPVATSSAAGYLAAADWATFNTKQTALTLTTTGTSGAATLSGGALNIPNYAGGGSSGINTGAQYSAPYYASTTTVSGASGSGVPVFATGAVPTFTALGTSGATIPLNNSANSWGANQSVGATGTAVSGTNDGSYTFSLCGSYFNATALPDCMGITEAEGAGTNPTLTVNYLRTGAATGTVSHVFTLASGKTLTATIDSGSNVSLQSNGNLDLAANGGFVAKFSTTAAAFSLPVTTTGTFAGTVGSAIASASTIAPASVVVHVTGTTAISTITVPAGMSSTVGGCVNLIPDGLWSTGTGGNIALASTAVVSRVLRECYDGTKWYPSY